MVTNNRGAAIASGFVCNFHPAAMGSSPKHTIYAFSIYICHLNWNVKRTKIIKKRPGLAHFFLKKNNVSIIYLLEYVRRVIAQQTKIFRYTTNQN